MHLDKKGEVVEQFYIH